MFEFKSKHQCTKVFQFVVAPMLGAVLVGGSIVLGCAALIGCAVPPGSSPGTSSNLLAIPSKLRTLHVERPELLRVNSLLLAPVQFSGKARLGGGGHERFDHELEAAATRELDISVMPSSKATDLLKPGVGSEQFASRSLEVARRLGVDGVIITTVNTVEERDGSRVGAALPAALGFSMQLLRVSNGRSVWSVDYFVQDQAVSENLLRAPESFGPEGSPGWKSLQQYLVKSFSEALQDFRINRETAFGANVD